MAPQTEDTSDTPLEGDAARAYAAALRLLAGRPRSEAELGARLSKRFPKEAVAQAVARLKALGYLDDAAFAQGWVHGRLTTKPRSCSLLRRELKDKGIGRQEAEEATRSVDDEAEAYRAASRVAEGLRREGFTVFRRRLWGYLRRRGFSSSVTLRTIRRLWQDDQG